MTIPSDRTNESSSGYTFNNQNFQNQTRTDSQGNSYNVAIPTSILSTPQTPVTVVNPQYNTQGQQTQANLITTDLQNSYNTAQTNADTANAQALANAKTQSEVQSTLGLKSSDLATAYNTQDATGNSVNSLAGQLRSYNAQSQALNLDNLAKQQAEINKATGQNITSQAVQRNTADATRENLIKVAQIGIQSAIAKADYETAKSYADQMISAKYDGIEANIKANQTMIDAFDKYTLTPAQKKAAEAQTELNAQKLRDIADKKAQEKDLQSLSLSIAKNGAPAKVQEAIRNAKDFNDAVIVATPYMQSAMDKADLSYKLAQTAKVYADMRNDAQTVGSNVAPENMLPFSQEYASTGKIPVGAPKGSASAIMRYAKELPQPTGALVSSITGVNPSNIGTVEQKDLSALYNITKNVAELKKLDDARVGGVVSGTLGKVFGSDAQSAYLAKRKAIVDDISRMQSGAALTADEVAFYEDYLPGRFSETAGLGQDSKKKIENFEKIMNDKLKNRLSNNNLSIYGYSTVTAPNGQEYKVGDLIQANGVTGRVNPDGSVTVVQ